MKTIICQRAGCGVSVEAKSPRQKYCPVCKVIEKREKHRVNIAAYQRRRKQTAIPAARLDRYAIRSRATVAKMMGITEEGVRVLEISALGKIQRALAQFAQ